MRPFLSRLLKVQEGEPSALSPVPFQDRVDELTLEKWIVEQPDLVGEPLLVLGRQLAEFEEDKDRLDVLAVDEKGELVLIELKVTEDFRVTDLQALAYAGAYAARETADLVRTLQHYVAKLGAEVEAAAIPSEDKAPAPNSDGLPASPDKVPSPETVPEVTSASSIAPLDEAKAKIAKFLKLDDFNDWQPSQHVRIKLVAPQFPRRVLKTVKWLGDVYGMPIEAITVRLFETGTGQYSLAFERVLPLPEEKEFDMTVRDREDRRRAENVSRRASVLPALVENGALKDGQTLWVVKTVLPVAHRDLFDDAHVAFRVRVHAPANGSPKLAWKPNEDSDEEILSPSLVAYKIYQAILLDWNGDEFTTAVSSSFTVEPGGKTLEELALETGAWQPTT